LVNVGFLSPGSGRVEEVMEGSTRVKVYFVENTETGRIKIGFTAGAVSMRVAQLQTGSDSLLRLLGVVEADDALGTAERQLHLKFAKWHYRGEWFTRAALPLVRDVLHEAKGRRGPVVG
jgi:hypothetical protein